MKPFRELDFKWVLIIYKIIVRNLSFVHKYHSVKYSTSEFEIKNVGCRSNM